MRHGKKGLQMSLFKDVRRRASLCPTRPVTPEVAGSSPVAPAKVPANRRLLLPTETYATAGFFASRADPARESTGNPRREPVGAGNPRNGDVRPTWPEVVPRTMGK
jgi:hypothetical protein